MTIFIIILLSKAISSCRSIATITIIVFKLVAARGNINLGSGGTHFSRVSS
ncbi:hypothetical protein AAHE18_01G246300 [Arachis hypogaea]